jgi:hypothetical protein
LKVAFYNVKGKKNRGPGAEVNLNTLYAEVKAEDIIVTEGWNTLGNSSLQMRERLEVIKCFDIVLLSFQVLIVFGRVIYNQIIWNLRM